MRISFGLCLVLLVGCGARDATQQESIKVPGPHPYGANIVLAPASATVVQGHTQDFSIGSGVGPFTCTSTTEASVPCTGNVCTFTASTVGPDSVSCTDSSNTPGSANVTVVAPSIMPTSASLDIGDTVTFVPQHEQPSEGTFASSNAAVATIDATGSLSAVGGGTTTVSFTDTASAIKVTATVTVEFGTPATDVSSATVPPRGTQVINITGGGGPFTCTVAAGSGGGSGAGAPTITGRTCTYVAGSASGSDIVTITDTNTYANATASTTVNISISAGVSISPTSPTVVPGDVVNFTASGGDNAGFTWSFANTGDNASGATLVPMGNKVKYTAGPTNNVVDQLTVTDDLGNTQTVSITVGAAVAITEGDQTVGPNDTFSFHATGGKVGSTITFSLVTTPSHFGAITTAGVYTAPPAGSAGKIDTVQASDGNGHVATAHVTIGPDLAITGAVTTIPPGSTIQLGASGGSGKGYAWANTNNSGTSAVVSQTGSFHIGHKPGQTDTVTLTDSTSTSNPTSHNVATVMITTGPGITISSSTTSIAPNGTIALTASGGEGSNFTWTATTVPSGGTVTQNMTDSTKATYKAGPTGSTTGMPIVDTITVTDGYGNTKTISITVTKALSVSAANNMPDPNMNVVLTAANGSGTYTNWKILPNNSGAMLSATTGATVTYKSGTTSGSDTVIVTDSFGSTASTTIGVGNALSVNPSTVTVKPLGSITIAPTGGLTPYAFTIETSPHGTLTASGNTATYKAGGGASGTTQSDTVTITDKNGASVTVAITVGPKLEISPTTAALAPKGTQQFTLTGGDQSSVTWTVSSGNGASVSTSGLYTAGSVGSVNDTVTATDVNGNTASATVTVGAPLSSTVTPSTVPPRGSATFAGLNGQAPYAYSLTTTGSTGTVAASVNATTGAYKAGDKPDTTDKVTISDANNVTKVQSITIGHGITISPATPSVAPNASQTFTASGGAGSPYTWSVAAGSSSNGSGGTINSSTGVYTAGATPSSIDTVTATDSLGNTASVNVSVGGGIAISPATPTTAPKGMVTFMASGGSGTGFKWKLSPSASGGSINTTSGVYIAGPTGNVQDTVVVTDSVGNTSKESIAVGAAVQISPPASMVQPGGTLAFSVMGGTGMGYVWSIQTNNSGGTIDDTGAYTAGPTSGTDVINVVDSLGNTAVALVSVAAPTPSPDMGTADDMATTSNDMATSTTDAATSPDDLGTTTKKSGGCDVGGSTGTSPLLVLLGLAFVAFFARRRITG